MLVKIKFKEGIYRSESYECVTKFEVINGYYLMEDVCDFRFKIPVEEVESLTIQKIRS